VIQLNQQAAVFAADNLSILFIYIELQLAIGMSDLAPFFVEKAVRELGENESRRKQSIALFTEWLKNHPFIKADRRE
jgi:hypothetical protein